MSVGFLFYGYGMALTAAFNGAGDTRTPTLINLVSLWLLEVPLAWVLANPLGFGPTGAFIALCVGFSTMCFLERVDFPAGAVENGAGVIVRSVRLQADARRRPAEARSRRLFAAWSSCG